MKYLSKTKRTHFQKEPKAIADRILKVFCNGTDITDDISINSCIQDMYVYSTADRLTLKFSDINKILDGCKSFDKRKICR